MRKRTLYSAEWLTIIYIAITVLYLLALFPRLHDRMFIFGIRIAVIFIIGLLAFTSRKKQWQRLDTVRQFLPFLMLGYWYSETFYIAKLIFHGQDYFFYHLDYLIFGCQPSLVFSKVMPQAWFSELMYFGYFCLYIFMFGIPLWFWFKKRMYFDRVVFVLIFSAFLYYSVFDLLPVAGPQFYLPVSEIQVPDGYLFCSLVRLLQHLGENPTGSFPSSHVGITGVLLLLAFRYDRKLFWYMLPFAIVLMLSTVYIKAHYLVDVVGGIASAFLFYFLSNRVYEWLGSERDREELSE